MYIKNCVCVKARLTVAEKQKACNSRLKLKVPKSMHLIIANPMPGAVGTIIDVPTLMPRCMARAGPTWKAELAETSFCTIKLTFGGYRLKDLEEGRLPCTDSFFSHALQCPHHSNTSIGPGAWHERTESQN